MFDEESDLQYSEEEQLLQGVNIAQSITCLEQSQLNQKKVYLNKINKNSCVEIIGCKCNQNTYENTKIEFANIYIEIEKLKRQNEILRKRIKQDQNSSSLKKSLRNSTIRETKTEKYQKSMDQSQKSEDKLNFYLDKCSSDIQSIRCLINFQEYCYAERVGERINKLINEMQFTIQQFIRQKKAFQRQIKSLHKINLKLTNILQENQKQLSNFANQINSTPYPRLSKKQIFLNHSFGSTPIDTQTRTRIQTPFRNATQFPFGFARTFSHSLDQIELLGVKQQQIYTDINSQYSQERLIDIIFAIKNLAKGENKCDYQKIYSLANGQKLKDWLQQIYTNITEKKAQQKLTIFGNKNQKNQSLQAFLKTIGSAYPTLLKKTRSIDKRSIELFNSQIVLYVTYLQIILTERKYFEIKTINEYNCRFWRQINKIRLRSGVQLAPQMKNYLVNMEEFITQFLNNQE